MQLTGLQVIYRESLQSFCVFAFQCALGWKWSGLNYFTGLNWIISPTMMLTDLTLCCLFPFLFYHKRGMEFGMLYYTVYCRLQLVKKWVTNSQPYKIQQSNFNEVNNFIEVIQCLGLNEVKMLRISANVKMYIELFTTHYFINSTVDKTKTWCCL